MDETLELVDQYIDKFLKKRLQERIREREIRNLIAYVFMNALYLEKL